MSLLTRYLGQRPRTTASHPMVTLQDEMNRLFESFFSGSGPLANWPTQWETGMSEWRPNVNVSETEKDYRVTAELPGIDEKNIELTFANNTLTIRGEKKLEKKDEKENFHHVEVSYGSFMRSIPFATEVDENLVKADFDKGVLTVRLGKKETSGGARKIEIK